MSSSADAALKLEIARLTGAITQVKTGPSHFRPSSRPPHPPNGGRSNKYVNPNYKPPSRPAAPPTSTSSALAQPRPQPVSAPAPIPTIHKKEVTIDGVNFVSSGRTLVRKDLASASRPPATRPRQDHVAPRHHPYKTSANSRGGRVRRGGNMTLTNNRRPYGTKPKRKLLDKPCPRFTMTGSCNRGLTCAYQHDPAKIAICWKFLQGDCNKTAEACNLSHDPIPERTPLCVHFADRGRCNRQGCPFPHVRVGPRSGVCRDFAVLGYCEKGLDCEQNHVRECPDFAEKGECAIKGCKLPHVIRANRNRKPATSTPAAMESMNVDSATSVLDRVLGPSDATDLGPLKYAEDAQIGDEFISLTFHESEEESEDGEEDGEEGEDEGEDEDEDVEVDGTSDQELAVTI